MSRIIFAFAVAAVVAAVVSGIALAGGNAGAALLCQHDGWRTVAPSSSSLFVNDGACVSFAARGGDFVALTADLDVTVRYDSASSATVTVANNGPHDATNVQMLVDGGNDSGGWSVDYPGGGWSFVDFGPGSRSVIFGRGLIAAGGSAAFTLTQSFQSGTIAASVWASDEPDPDPSNNSASVNLTS